MSSNLPPGCTLDEIDDNFDGGWGEWTLSNGTAYAVGDKFPVFYDYTVGSDIEVIKYVDITRTNRTTSETESREVELFLAKMDSKYIYYSEAESLSFLYTESNGK